LNEDQYTILIVSRSVILRMGNVSDKLYREDHSTHFIFSNYLDNCAVCKIMWKSIVEPDRPQMTIWPMRFAC